ncbi:MAG: Acyl-CoA synthetase forming, partial [Ilumatobacteraceae bacterium]|nr:Acyl-CoA synthetase forming [Ilumatobacteraceae bacterium]
APADQGSVDEVHRGRLPVGLLAPRSVAVVGASPRPGSFAGRALLELQRHGFTGAAAAVNPNYDEVFGVPSYPDLVSVPEPPDLVLVFVPASRVADTILEAGAVGAAAAIVFSSGFAEIGADGRRLDDELREAIARSGVRVLGPNCQGMVNFGAGVVATFTGAVTADDIPAASRFAYVGQSGAIGGSFFDLTRARGFVPSVWVSTGNELDVTTVDVLDGLIDAATVDTICIYVERLPEHRAWKAGLRRARAAGLRVLVLRSGRADAGRRAAAGHTGSLVGGGRGFELLTRAEGGVLVEDLDDLVDLVVAAEAGFGRGDRIGIVTSSGGAGGIAADLSEIHGLAVPALAAETMALLGEFVPDFGAVCNPVDVTAQLFSANPDDFGTVCRITAADPGVDQLLVVLSMIPEPMASRLAESLCSIGDDLTVPLAVVYLASHDRTEQARRILADHRVPDYDSIRAAITAIATLRANPPMSADGPPVVDASPNELARSDELARLLDEPDAITFTEWEAGVLLDVAGVHRPGGVLAHDRAEASASAATFGAPVVMKVQAPSLTHKSDHAAVRVGVEPGAAAAVFDELIAAADRGGFTDVDGVLVQAMAAPGVELLVGVTAGDDGYPPIVTVGLGGTAVELLGDVASATAPIDPPAAERLLRQLRGFPLLDGFRGRLRSDVGAAAHAIAALSQVAMAFGGRLDELEVNPLIVHEIGSGVTAVDLLLTLRPVSISADDR